MEDDGLDFNTLAEIVHKGTEAQESDELRKKRDWLTYVPVILSLISFCIVVAVWVIWDRANPYPTGTTWGWLGFFGLYPEEGLRWPRRQINIAYILLIISLILCVIAFLGNRMRMKRKGDKYRISVFLAGAISLVTFVSFMIKFIPMGIIGNW